MFPNQKQNEVLGTIESVQRRLVVAQIWVFTDRSMAVHLLNNLAEELRAATEKLKEIP